MNYGGGGGGGGRGLGLGGGSHRSWFAYVRSGDEHPQVTSQLMRRVFTYARPYWKPITGMLVAILISTGLTLLTPLIFRNMIDQVIPAGDVHRLILLALALLIIPVLNGVIGVFQRQWNAIVGEGVIFDLPRGFILASSAHEFAILYEHQDRRVDEPPQQRRGRRAGCH